MPKCINDLNKSYIGNEPSPKGLGFCAHAEKIGTIKKGKDGNMWIIKKTNNLIHRWIKITDKIISEKKTNDKQNPDNKLDCTKFVEYIDPRTKHTIKGLELKKGFINQIFELNNLEKKATKIPKNYKKKKIQNNFIKKYCDSTKEKLTKNIIKINHPNSKQYFIHNNGKKPFLVYISKNECNIYTYNGINDNKYYLSQEDIDNEEKWIYFNKVATYKNPIKVFIGKSPKIKIFINDFGKDFDGNTILLQIEKENYVFIGPFIYEFSIKDDKIIEYYSPLNYDIPNPYAIGNKNIYFMRDMVYVPIDNFSNLNNEEFWFEFNPKKKYKKIVKPILNTKKINIKKINIKNLIIKK
jgi:hypothetical protein